MKTAESLLSASPRQFFADRIDEAVIRLKFEPLPASRAYLAELLEHFMFAENLNRGTLAETYLKAQSSPLPVKVDLLKKLGDSSLYISGFFGDSLARKVVDIDYYVGMGGVAYGTLSSTTNGDAAKMYGEFSSRFAAFVDVLTYISQDSLVQSNKDLLRLYDRYLATGSRLAEEQLMEKGLLNADVPRAKNTKM